MYSTLKLEKLPRIRNSSEEGMNTQVVNKALPIPIPQLGPRPYYFRYCINTHEDKHPALKSYNLKKASAFRLQKVPNQTNHTAIIKERGKALRMGYINKVLF